MDNYQNGNVVTLTVSSVSVGIAATDLKPVSGKWADRTMCYAMIRATGPLYVETGGIDATTDSLPLNAGDIVYINGQENIKKLRFIRNTSDTTATIVPGYL